MSKIVNLVVDLVKAKIHRMPLLTVIFVMTIDIAVIALVIEIIDGLGGQEKYAFVNREDLVAIDDLAFTSLFFEVVLPSIDVNLSHIDVFPGGGIELSWVHKAAGRSENLKIGGRPHDEGVESA